VSFNGDQILQHLFEKAAQLTGIVPLGMFLCAYVHEFDRDEWAVAQQARAGHPRYAVSAFIEIFGISFRCFHPFTAF
jgi:hypothetical protein